MESTRRQNFTGRGAKIINMGELFAHPRMRSIEMKRLEMTPLEMEKANIQPGDLLFARRSLVAEGAGKCSIVLDVNEETTFESSLIRARLNRDNYDPKFYYYFFKSQYGRDALWSITRTVAVSGITGSDLKELEVPTPDYSVQKSIVGILSFLDDKIDLLREMNTTLEVIARSLFRAWFVDFEPVRTKAAGATSFRGMPQELFDALPDSFEDSEIGEIPKGSES